MNVERRKKDAIYGMCLYVEECMREITNQMNKDDVNSQIVQRRLENATGTMEALRRTLKGMDIIQ